MVLLAPPISPPPHPHTHTPTPTPPHPCCLCSALLAFLTVPWTLCFCIYSLLHWTWVLLPLAPPLLPPPLLQFQLPLLLLPAPPLPLLQLQQQLLLLAAPLLPLPPLLLLLLLPCWRGSPPPSMPLRPGLLPAYLHWICLPYWSWPWTFLPFWASITRVLPPPSPPPVWPPGHLLAAGTPATAPLPWWRSTSWTRRSPRTRCV